MCCFEGWPRGAASAGGGSIEKGVAAQQVRIVPRKCASDSYDSH
eukprot:gene10772-6573_t